MALLKRRRLPLGPGAMTASPGSRGRTQGPRDARGRVHSVRLRASISRRPPPPCWGLRGGGGRHPAGHARNPRARAPAVTAPPRLTIEAPTPSLADLRAMAAEHGYDVIRQDREDGALMRPAREPRCVPGSAGAAGRSLQASSPRDGDRQLGGQLVSYLCWRVRRDVTPPGRATRGRAGQRRPGAHLPEGWRSARLPRWHRACAGRASCPPHRENQAQPGGARGARATPFARPRALPGRRLARLPRRRAVSRHVSWAHEAGDG